MEKLPDNTLSTEKDEEDWGGNHMNECNARSQQYWRCAHRLELKRSNNDIMRSALYF